MGYSIGSNAQGDQTCSTVHFQVGASHCQAATPITTCRLRRTQRALSLSSDELNERLRPAKRHIDTHSVGAKNSFNESVIIGTDAHRLNHATASAFVNDRDPCALRLRRKIDTDISHATSLARCRSRTCCGRSIRYPYPAYCYSV